MAVKKYFKIAFLLFLVLPLGGIILGKLTQKEQHNTPSTRTRPPAPVAIKTASAHPWEFFKRENEVALFDSEIILDNLLALLKTNDAFQIWSYTKKIQEGNFLGTTCDHEVCQQLRWGIRGLHDSMKNGQGIDFSALESAKNNLGQASKMIGAFRASELYNTVKKRPTMSEDSIFSPFQPKNRMECKLFGEAFHAKYKRPFVFFLAKEGKLKRYPANAEDKKKIHCAYKFEGKMIKVFWGQDELQNQFKF